MKRFFLIFILFFVITGTVTSQYWLTVPSPTSKTFRKCCLLDTVYGWASGDSGLIVHTSNGGADWVVQNSGIDFHSIEDIFFINQRLGWAISNDFFYEGTLILNTTNGGANWSVNRYPDSSIVFSTVYFLDSVTGFLTGYSGRVFKTTTAGSEWFECHVDTAFCSFLYLFPKNKFTFINDQTGYVCGGQIDIQGIVWRTTDAGLNWFTWCVAPEPLYGMKVFPNGKVAATGGDPDYGISFVVSSNSGDSWRYTETGFFGVGRSAAYRTPAEVWVPGSYSQKFLVNLDSGNIGSDWIQILPPQNIDLNATQFVTPTYGWTFCAYGVILKYNTAVIGIINNEPEQPEKYTLYQNYPNPFNPKTMIKFNIAEESEVNLSVYDAAGRLMVILADKKMEAGSFETEFNGTDLPSGVYFYVLTLNSKPDKVRSISKKMVLIK